MKKAIYPLLRQMVLTCLFALISLYSASGDIFAQCNISNPLTTGSTTSIVSVGQSFITISACGGGQITGISIWSTGSHTNITLNIYSGAGCSSLQHTQAVPFIGDGMGLPTLVDVSPDMTFTSGATYTFQFVFEGVSSLLKSTSNTYLDGSYFATCTENTSEDLFFIVHTNSILPVELTSFDARLHETQTHLTWRTASEKENAGFEIERSNDGETWKTLAFVPGNGTTNEQHDYHFTDEKPQPGDNYYRLKQLDFSGAAEYSDTRHVRLASGKLEDVLVSPNPVQAGQTLTVSNPLEGAGGDGIESVQLIDVLGRIAWEGGQFEGEKLEISLPTDLSKGLCWLVLNGGGERVVRKVLVH